MAIVDHAPPRRYADGDDAPDAPPQIWDYDPATPARDRRMRDDFALPQQQRFHAALLAMRSVAERRDLTASEQQRLQMLADYRAVQAEADWLRARLDAWWPAWAEQEAE